MIMKNQKTFLKTEMHGGDFTAVLIVNEALRAKSCGFNLQLLCVSGR